MDLQLLTKQTCSLAKNVGQYILSEIRKLSEKDINVKMRNNFVSYVDIESEKKLVKELGLLLPGSGFITEEDTIHQEKAEYTWIIDPLDGTTNFIHQLPLYSISIALSRNDEIILGVVYEINNDECFYSWKGGHAFLNKTEIEVSKSNSLNNSLLATGFPYYDYSRIDNYLGLLKECMKRSQGIRRMGSAAVDLAYVACGRFEVFFEYGLKPWDVAAGSFIVEQAKGNVTDFRNQKNYISHKEIVATNNYTHEEFINILSKYFA